eukprot:TRINITY_DN4525_c0_g1_i2.p1 TRINITY_DN4525_c0_g1~~TRINITY_DN4525_c0_g1_i2.p1  ORF type:complete len:240 (-),score=57.47 TRINITY_DN4525_c0_g1_i2:95-733(-)
MENYLFNLKFTAKQMAREAKKCEKNSKINQNKCKKAMEKGNTDGARIYAENSIRDKNQALNYLRLSSRIDAVSQRVQTAISMKSLTTSMSGTVKSMDSVMKTMNVEKISKVMEKFEKQFEDLDIASGFMENSISQSTAVTTPESEVEGLMKQVADEHGLEFESEMDKIGAIKKEKAKEKESSGKEKVKEKPKEIVLDEEGQLEERLRKLQGL